MGVVESLRGEGDMRWAGTNAINFYPLSRRHKSSVCVCVWRFFSPSLLSWPEKNCMSALSGGHFGVPTRRRGDRCKGDLYSGFYLALTIRTVSALGVNYCKGYGDGKEEGGKGGKPLYLCACDIWMTLLG